MIQGEHNWLKPGETIRGGHQKALDIVDKAHNLLRIDFARLQHGGTEPRTECMTILLKLQIMCL